MITAEFIYIAPYCCELFSDADPAIPILSQAKAEYEKLQ